MDIVSLTETDFESEKIAKEFSITGFSTFISTSGPKIRTILLVKSNLEVEQVTVKSALPVVAVKVKPREDNPIFVCSVYRQWSNNQLEEVGELQDVLSTSKVRKVIAMGDFNLDAACLLNSSTKGGSSVSERFKDICQQNRLDLKSCGPTYYYQQGQKSSELDFFLTREVEGCFTKVPFGNSDHDAIKAVITNNTPISKVVKKVLIRSKIRDPTRFRSDMKIAMNQAAMSMLDQEDPECQADIFIAAYKSVLDQHAQLKEVKALPRNIRHALSQETLSLRKERNTARNAWLKASPNEKKVKMEVFKRLRNRVNSLIKRDKALKSEEDLKSGIHPFQVAKSLLGDSKTESKIKLTEDGQTIEEEAKVASLINEFFVDKIEKLKVNINPAWKTDPLLRIKKLESKFSFQKVSVDHIQRVIGRMKNSGSSGIDGISAKMLKATQEEVSPALSVLVNTSLMTGIFPGVFKKAQITPLFKNKGSREDKSNYRPVSNLSTPGKVLEIVANIQITRYCEQVGILGKHQHGFRSGRSTTSAIISSLVKWQAAKEKKLFTGCLLYDLSAAYDTISPELLVKKAVLYGFDTTSANWLTSFTTGRYQAVRVGNFTSAYKQLKCGVPQGSPLSCVLFLMYVQDLPMWVNGGHIQGYADDTMHFISAKTREEVIKGLEKGATNILGYFASNELVANPTKTAFLLFRPSKSIESEQTIKVGSAVIQESASERVLGVQVQRTLEWDDHITKVISKVNYGLSVLRQLQGVLRREALKVFAEGTVMSHLRYGISVYLSGGIKLSPSDPTCKGLNRLQVKQNDAMRLVLNKKRKDLTPRETLLKEFNTKSVNQIAAEAVIMEMFRAFTYKVDAIQESFATDKGSRRPNMFRTSSDPTSFVSKAAKLWNGMSKEFRNQELKPRAAKQEASRAALSLPL